MFILQIFSCTRWNLISHLVSTDKLCIASSNSLLKVKPVKGKSNQGKSGIYELAFLQLYGGDGFMGKP